MNIAFVVDSSLSMQQAPNNQMTLLSMAKNGIEHIVKCRSRFMESKYDNYHLISTDIEYNNTLSSWEHDSIHFQYQLKNVTFSM